MRSVNASQDGQRRACGSAVVWKQDGFCVRMEIEGPDMGDCCDGEAALQFPVSSGVWGALR